MTIQEYLKSMNNYATRLKETGHESIVLPRANELLANIKNRIVQDGKNSDGAIIGQYGTKSSYFGADSFVKKGSFKPQGKGESIERATVNINTKKATVPKVQRVNTFNERGKPVKVAVKKQEGFQFIERKTMYLPGGYKELRNIQGLRIDKTNFSYSGSLLLSYQLSKENNAIVLGLTNEHEAKIRKGLEDGTKKKKGYGRVFYATKQELEEYKEGVAEDVRRLAATLKSL